MPGTGNRERQTTSHRRVGLIGSYPPPHGGQSVHVQSLAHYLSRYSLDREVFNTGSNKQVADGGVKNVASSAELLRSLLFGARFGLLHVHVSGPDDFPKLLPTALAALIKCSPWLVTIHSGGSIDRLRTANSLRKLVSRALLKRAKKIICVNNAIRDSLVEILGLGSLAVIPAFSLDFAGAALPKAVEGFMGQHEPVLSCLGLYEPLYGFDKAVLLLKAIRESYPKAGLLLIGDTGGMEWCRTLIDETGLDKDVNPCGNLGHQECLESIRRSAVFLRPTLYDGDSISVREALALGVPVVASKTDFRPEGVILYQTDSFEDLIAKTLVGLKKRWEHESKPPRDYSCCDRIAQLYREVGVVF